MLEIRVMAWLMTMIIVSGRDGAFAYPIRIFRTGSFHHA